jgi:hypothetical protein
MSRFYVAVDGQQWGPFGVEELRSQGLAAGSLVWAEGMANWQEARLIPELATALRQVAVPAAPPPPVVYPPPPQAPPPAYPAAQPQYPPGGAYPNPYPPAQINIYHPQPPIYQPVFVPVKNVGVAFLLTFFFGPLGMFYSTVTGGLVMLCVSIVAAALTAGLSVLLTWPACIIWGCVAARNYNSQMAARIGRR